MALSSAWALVASHSLPYATLEVWAYCTQNTSTLTSTVYTELGVRCATYTYSADGVKAGITGASDISWGYTQFGSNAYHKLTGGSYTVSHNSTTGAASTTIYYWLDQTFGGDIGSPYSPASVRVDLPTMSVKPPAPTKGTVSVSTKTYNSITYSWSGFSFGAGGTWGKYQYSYDNSSWIDTGQNTSHTRSSLSPNTSYTLYVRLVDNYGTASGVASISGTTNKPAVPSKGTVSASSITYNGAKFSWSGFSFGSGATWGKYQYSWNNSNWTDCGQSTNLTFTDRSPNTTYNFYVRLVDNYGQASAVASTSFTTSKPSAPSKGIVSVSTKTYNSITYSWSGFSFGAGGGWGKYQYSYDNSNWIDTGQNTSHTRSSLSPNTSYTLYVRLVDNYGTASSVASVAGTTNKPAAPTAGTILVKNITHRGATLFWDGFAFGNGADFGKYQYNYNGFWIDCGADTTVTLKNLSSNASYTFKVRLIDNYGTASNSVSITFKTKSEESWKYVIQYIKVNGTWKYGIAYYKVDGVWKTITETYFKGRTPTVTLVDSNGRILTNSNGIVLNAIQ